MNLVLGIPIKINDTNLIYIPKSFWREYGIDPEHDNVVRAELPDQITFRRHSNDILRPHEKSVRVYFCSVHIRPDWMAANNLHVGDTVWLVGTEDGLTISANQSLNGLE